MILPLISARLALCIGMQDDPVVLTFGYFGCDRVDVGDWKKDPLSNPSSANLPEVEQDLRDLEALDPRPDFVFLCGDIVANYRADEGQVLRGQLDAFQSELDKSGAGKSLRIIAFPGNHELNKKKDDAKSPNLVCDKVWTDWLAASRFAPPVYNGPTPESSPEDHLADDQSKLNVSFVEKGVKFVLLNTDARTTLKDQGSDTTRVAWAPAVWASHEIEAGERDANVKAVVVMGHRNLIDTDSVKSDSPIAKDAGATLLASFEQNSKARLYACSHVHAWDMKPLNSHAWQVVEGRGGSPFEKGWNPSEGQTFGFTVIKVHQSGKMDMLRYSRPFAQGGPAKCDLEKPLT